MTGNCCVFYPIAQMFRFNSNGAPDCILPKQEWYIGIKDFWLSWLFTFIYIYVLYIW